MDKTVFSVYLGNPDNDNGTTLDLPVRPWAMRDALEKLRLREGQEPYWQVEDLGRYDFLTPYLDGYDLYKFNALAEKISTFDDVNAMAFEGLVQMKIDKLCQSNGSELTLQQVLDFAYSTDCCHVVAGITDDATLGHFYVENDFLPELENVPDRVLELLDYTKIGRTMREGEGGVFTPPRLCDAGGHAAAGSAQFGQTTPRAAVYDLFPLRQRCPCRKVVPACEADGTECHTGRPGSRRLAGGTVGGS